MELKHATHFRGMRDRGHAKHICDLAVAEMREPCMKDLAKWNEIFGEFLLNESDERLEKVLDYLQSKDVDDMYIYYDVLDVLGEWQSDKLIAVFSEAIPKLDLEEFKRVFPVACDVIDNSNLTALGAAKLVIAILEMSEDVPKTEVKKLKDLVRTREWPREWDVALTLLRAERLFNKLLIEKDTFFADRVPDTYGEIGNAIYIEKLFIRSDWPEFGDDATFDLPYVVRKYLGHKEEIEEELSSLMEEFVGTMIILSDCEEEEEEEFKEADDTGV